MNKTYLVIFSSISFNWLSVFTFGANFRQTGSDNYTTPIDRDVDCIYGRDTESKVVGWTPPIPSLSVVSLSKTLHPHCSRYMK